MAPTASFTTSFVVLRGGEIVHESYPGYFAGGGNQWWTLGGERRPFTAVGIHGQYLYVDPDADVVIVKTSAWPRADDPSRDAESVTALRAVADRLHEDQR
ncbi:hypothetical protein [Streptomyces afghaniensis]|uniref:hypothetical protein n=1 Tax=Streptomyces afghaniensis TaxID=66865 RepID=UPI0027D8809E|nr:hypothetical protein [Streptomyces afghaniensis]